jgi:hypothetical protein
MQDIHPDESEDRAGNDMADDDEPVGAKEAVFVNFSKVNFTDIRQSLARPSNSSHAGKAGKAGKPLAGLPAFEAPRPAHHAAAYNRGKGFAGLGRDLAPTPSSIDIKTRVEAMFKLRSDLQPGLVASPLADYMVKVVVVHTHPASSVRQGSDARIAQVFSCCTHTICHHPVCYR